KFWRVSAVECKLKLSVVVRKNKIRDNILILGHGSSRTSTRLRIQPHDQLNGVLYKVFIFGLKLFLYLLIVFLRKLIETFGDYFLSHRYVNIMAGVHSVELQKEALLQVAGGNTRRIESLYLFENPLHRLRISFNSLREGQVIYN